MILLLLFTLLVPQAPARDAEVMRREVVGTGWLTLDDVRFAGRTAVLEPQSESMLRQLLALMKTHDEWRFEVQSHPEPGGSPDGRLALAQKRAETVVKWLTSRGVTPIRLVAKGYADPDPDAKPHLLLRKLNEE